MVKFKNKKVIAWAAWAAVLITVTILAWPQKNKSSAPTESEAAVSAAPPAAVKAATAQLPVDQASSLWAVVNKGRILPASYVPANLLVPNVPLRLSVQVPEMKLRSDAAK